MIHRSHILNKQPWEVEMDILQDLKDHFRIRLSKVGINSTSDNPIYDYYNYAKRFVAPKPRKVVRSNEFVCPVAYGIALQEIIDKITSGTSILPYLSKSIANAEYNDALLNDWGIHHLHLSRRMGRDGFIQRSDYQLFAFFTDDSCYLIQIYPHNKPWLYSTQEMVKIIDDNWPELIDQYRINADLIEKLSDEQYAKLRKSHVSTFVQTSPNRIYGMIGGGYMSNGTSHTALRASGYWYTKCRCIEIDLKNTYLGIITQLIIQETGNCYMPLNIKLLFFKTDDTVVLAESSNHVAIEINYKQQYIRVCKHTMLYHM